MHCHREDVCCAALAPEQTLYIVIISVLPYAVCMEFQFEFRTALLCTVLVMCFIDQLAVVTFYQVEGVYDQKLRTLADKGKGWARSSGRIGISLCMHGP